MPWAQSHHVTFRSEMWSSCLMSCGHRVSCVRWRTLAVLLLSPVRLEPFLWSQSALAASSPAGHDVPCLVGYRSCGLGGRPAYRDGSASRFWARYAFAWEPRPHVSPTRWGKRPFLCLDLPLARVCNEDICLACWTTLREDQPGTEINFAEHQVR